MKMAKSVEEYLSFHPEWADSLQILRKVVSNLGMEEEMKWGAPHYTVNKKNVVGLGAFKSYVGLWFHQGVFLKDEAKVLINAQEGTTKALRQWRFNSPTEIDEDLVKTYVLEAIENQKAGKMIKPERQKTYDMPDELKHALKTNDDLAQHFFQLTFGKQKEYANHISSAKQEATRLKRLDKITPMILSGIGLNDKYRK